MLISLHSSFFPDNFCRSKQRFLEFIFDLSSRTRVMQGRVEKKLTSFASMFRIRLPGQLFLCLRWFVLHRVYRGKRIWLISSLDIDFSPIKLYIFLIRTTSWTWKCKIHLQFGWKLTKIVVFPTLLFSVGHFGYKILTEMADFQSQSLSKLYRPIL